MIEWYYVPVALILGAIAGAAAVCLFVIASGDRRIGEDVIRRIELEEDERC